MIRNMQIRSKLIAVLVIPLVALTVLAALGIGANVARGVQADRVNDQTAFAISLSTWCTSCSGSATCRPAGSGAAATPATAAWSPSGWPSTRRSETFRRDAAATSATRARRSRGGSTTAVARFDRFDDERERIESDPDLTVTRTLDIYSEPDREPARRQARAGRPDQRPEPDPQHRHLRRPRPLQGGRQPGARPGLRGGVGRAVRSRRVPAVRDQPRRPGHLALAVRRHRELRAARPARGAPGEPATSPR